MFWKRHDEAKRLPRLALCCADSDMTRASADALARRGLCEPIALLADTPQNILWLCRRAKPDLLLLEALPDSMERFDDPDKDIAGRCETAARVQEEVPGCRAYLTCAEEFRHLEPVMRKAVENSLISGYCFGALTGQQLELWLGEFPANHPLKGGTSCNENTSPSA